MHAESHKKGNGDYSPYKTVRWILITSYYKELIDSLAK